MLNFNKKISAFFIVVGIVYILRAAYQFIGAIINNFVLAYANNSEMIAKWFLEGAFTVVLPVILSTISIYIAYKINSEEIQPKKKIDVLLIILSLLYVLGLSINVITNSLPGDITINIKELLTIKSYLLAILISIGNCILIFSQKKQN